MPAVLSHSLGDIMLMTKKLRCWLCRDSHKISDCTVLKASPVDDQRELVKENKLCFNCLS